MQREWWMNKHRHCYIQTVQKMADRQNDRENTRNRSVRRVLCKQTKIEINKFKQQLDRYTKK